MEKRVIQMDISKTVTIPIEHYKRLLDTETRVKVLIDIICFEKSISVTEILRILATDEALLEVDRIIKESEK